MRGSRPDLPMAGHTWSAMPCFELRPLPQACQGSAPAHYARHHPTGDLIGALDAAVGVDDDFTTMAALPSDDQDLRGHLAGTCTPGR